MSRIFLDLFGIELDYIKNFFKTVDFRPIVRVDDQAPWDAADATVCTILHTYIYFSNCIEFCTHTHNIEVAKKNL